MNCRNENNRVRFIADPFTGKLAAQVYITYGLRGGRYDHFTWTSDLRYLKKTSCARPKIFTLVPVKD